MDRTRSTVCATLMFLLALAVPGVGSAVAGETQSLYRLSGNHYILREGDGGRYVTVYRQAGDQWERFARATASRGTYGGIAGRIIAEGRYLGPSGIDLDDWMNTDLNLNGPDWVQ